MRHALAHLLHDSPPLRAARPGHNHLPPTEIMILVTIILGSLALILLLPLISDLVALARLPRRRRRAAPTSTEPPRLLFLVPAHDEELLLGRTLLSLRRLDYPTDRYTVVVVADNCSDRTAEIAREAGVTCLERYEPTLRGKPHAIAWALEQLDITEYDGVVITDADSLLDPGFARGLAAHAPIAGKVLQCYNDVENRTDSALTRMGAVFSAVRCVLMNELKDRNGLNVPLGNGLCLGTGVIARYGWNAFSICEDWELYAELTGYGVRLENAIGARIFSQETRSLRQSSTQRQRWAAGKILVLRRYAGRLLRSRRIGIHQKLDLLAELTAPGPAVHLGLVAIALLANYTLDLPYAHWLTIALLLPLARTALYSALAIARGPEPVRTTIAFLYLPFYTAWRLGVQAAALSMVGNGEWIRTSRHRAAEPRGAKS